ncbi:hypothetical protein PCIT_a3901 [Pseudoalteromonas citrea]|uniref:OmpR/PhoB-type domain-containing protein n=2 Tax=Pseudoalteromonas citrea TaxID=43655 RepID=A0AAD4FQV6_9GAMM|nr:winged helix-turn-helix domain-containing protein [Pseudoalteromonas citrea]KAF7767805.1 hypothetical protein PCIT_a3901 [Pseudoalteromonas citrea]
MSYTFNSYSFDPILGVLYLQEDAVQLRPKLAQLLEYFLLNAGRIITREELLSALWVNGEYRESSLTQSIRELRKQLSDSVQNPLFIKTYPQRGYIWICEVDVPDDAVSIDEPLQNTQQNIGLFSRIHQRLPVFLLSLLLLIAGLFLVIGFTMVDTRPTSMSEPHHNERLLIAPFKNLTGETEFDWLNYGLRHLLIQNLKESGIVTVIPNKPSFHLLSQEHEAHNNVGATLQSLVEQGHAERWLEATVSQESGRFVFHYTLSDIQGNIKKGVIYSDDLNHPLPNLATTFAQQLVGKTGMVSTFHVSESDFSTKDYLEGLYALETRGVGLAMRYFEASVLHDPNNVHALVELARTYWHTGRLQKAADMFEQLSQHPTLLAKPSLNARMLEYWGEMKVAKGEYTQANTLLEHALVMTDEIDNDVLRSKIYRKLATIAWQQQNWHKYRHFISQAKNLFEIHDMTESEARRLYYIGNPPPAGPETDQTVDLEDSLQSLYKSVRYYRQNGNLSSLMKTYFALGQNYLAPLEERNQALLRALKLATDQQELVYQIKIANYLGFYFIQLHEGEKAIEYIELAEQVLNDELDMAPLRYRNQLLLSMAKMDHGIANNDKAALHHAKLSFERLLGNLEAFNSHDNIKADAYLLLSWTELALQQSHSALKNQKAAHTLYQRLNMHDSLSYAVYSLMYTYLTLGDNQSAIELASSGQFNKKLMYDYTALAFYRLGDVDNAILQLDKMKQQFSHYWQLSDERRYKQLTHSELQQSELKRWFSLLQKPYSVYCESEWNFQIKVN